MDKLFFCNIGWMTKYQGLRNKNDKIVGGGRYVEENEYGGEICNFLKTDDGNVYGFVETSRNDKELQIHLERFFGVKQDSVSGIDVVWIATHPVEGGRRVVGWYRNATLFRHRQKFERPPSKQHRLDQLKDYHIYCSGKNAHLISPEDRTLELGHGSGWMGQNAWWKPNLNNHPEQKKFVKEVIELMNGEAHGTGETSKKKKNDKSPPPPKKPHVRYLEEYEIEIQPRHHKLQSKFEEYLNYAGYSDLVSNHERVDLRFRNQDRDLVLAEIKPCDIQLARYAIRTAMGQLLDYRQKTDEEARMLIVLDVKPYEEDRLLALSNGFGIAFPDRKKFSIIWK